MGKKFAFSGNVDNNVKMLEEGTYVFQILDAKYNEEMMTKAGKVNFDVVMVKLINKEGDKHTEFFNLTKVDNKGEKVVNDFNVKHLVRLCATALQDDSLKTQPLDIDVLPDILDKYIQVDIQHSEYNGKTNVNIAPFSYVKADNFDSVDELDNL